MNASITFKTDGNGFCLYTEAIPLHQIGVLRIKRATSIEFNNRRQVWQVKVHNKILHQAFSRQACLDWEHSCLNDEKTIKKLRGCREQTLQHASRNQEVQ